MEIAPETNYLVQTNLNSEFWIPNLAPTIELIFIDHFVDFDFSRGLFTFTVVKIPRDSTGYGIIPVEFWKSRSRPNWSHGNVRDPDPVPCFFWNPDPVQTSPVKIRQIPWNPCPVPCKPVKFEIFQIPSKPVPWFREPVVFIPWFLIQRDFPGIFGV